MQQRPIRLPNACVKTRGLNPRRLQVRCTLSWRNERYRIGAVIFAKAVSTLLTLAIIFSNKNSSWTILQYAKKSHFFLAIGLHIHSYLTNFMAQGKNSAKLFTFAMQNTATKAVFALVYLWIFARFHRRLFWFMEFLVDWNTFAIKSSKQNFYFYFIFLEIFNYNIFLSWILTDRQHTV